MIVTGFIDPHKLITHTISFPKAYKYAKDMEAGDTFPPVKAFVDKRNGQIRVKDGAHRTHAAKMCGKQLYVITKAHNILNSA